MSPLDAGSAAHLIGYLVAITIYAMLFAMVWPTRRENPLPLATAVMGCVWNLGSLWRYAAAELAIVPVSVAVGVATFAAVDLLPAVVVHSVLRDQLRGPRAPQIKLLTAAAYTLSVSAAISHVYAATTLGVPLSSEMHHLIGPGFGILIIPLALLTLGQLAWRRTLWIVALALVAVLGFDLAYHTGPNAWALEFIGHHASLLLAFAILYQDYRFALADLFLKRVLTLFGLVAAAFALHGVMEAIVGDGAAPLRDPRVQGIVLGLIVALLAAPLRRGATWLVDTLVIRREPHGLLRLELARLIAGGGSVSTVLEQIRGRLAEALDAADAAWTETPGPDTDPIAAVDPSADPLRASALVQVEERRTHAIMTLPTAEPPRYQLSLTCGAGGRLSLADEALLDAVAVMGARRIDAVRIVHERYEQQVREEQIGKLATEAELKALRAQLDPHFLFNAMNTVGHLIQTDSDRALDTLLDLTDLLRRVLRSEGAFTTLGREIDLIRSYLEIETARFEERLGVTIDVPAGLETVRVPPLIVLPLVENALKHGTERSVNGGRVSVSAHRSTSTAGGNRLTIRVDDTGADATADPLERDRRTGVGLGNLRQRLHGYYGDNAALTVDTQSAQGTRVEIELPLEAAPEVQADSLLTATVGGRRRTS
ncbi:MAG: histidine kinase [Vicinamibacterales bacterium]|nr:histidine kinase [Vicinamibacterales bacterium]